MPGIPLTYLLITMYYSRHHLSVALYYSPFRKYAMCSRYFTVRSEPYRILDQFLRGYYIGIRYLFLVYF